ncbi:MAG: hypothetical protein WBW16_08590 [Bacteroidota bacterium]
MIKRIVPRRCAVALSVIFILITSHSSAQFIDGFDGVSMTRDSRGANGWTFYTGDGSAVMDFFLSGKGYASVTVDATKDKRGIWWALIKRRVSKDIDLSLLSKAKYALRVEARIRVSDAPKRVNLHLNTERTTNFHTHLMEFDIPDTLNWHTISMTTHGFDAVPGDSVYGQLALMDWGLENYRVDLDYFKVDIVNTDSAGPDKGVQVPYHPPIPNPTTFTHHLSVVQDATIDLQYPDTSFNNWSTSDDTGRTILLTVSGTQVAILRWDLSAFAGKKVAGSGLLELTTYSLQRSPEYSRDFGMVRVSEIIGGDPLWNQGSVTFDELCQGQPLRRVINSQMIIDIEVSESRGSTTLATISNPVLQRMIDGKTVGLAIRPLGAVNASFYAMENQGGKLCAKLHFNLGSDSPVPVRSNQ